jgi:hypothetical protein
MNDLSFFYYGMVCVLLTLLGLVLTVLEFHRMSPRTARAGHRNKSDTVTEDDFAPSYCAERTHG